MSNHAYTLLALESWKSASSQNVSQTSTAVEEIRCVTFNAESKNEERTTSYLRAQRCAISEKAIIYHTQPLNNRMSAYKYRMVTAFQSEGGAQMKPAVLKMGTMQQKAQYQISNVVLARKMAGKEQEQQVMRIKHILILSK